MDESHGHWIGAECTGSTREKSYSCAELNPLILAHKQLFWWVL